MGQTHKQNRYKLPDQICSNFASALTVFSTNEMHIATSARRLASLVLLTGLATCMHLESKALAQRARFQSMPTSRGGFQAPRARFESIQMHKNQGAPRPGPAAQPAQGQRRPAQGPAGNPANRGPKGEHLAEWMNQHGNLSAEQQQKALEQEPGFHELPPQTQQRMRDRLSQLNAMSPEQRQRVLKNNEHMETLTPDQRGQVRGAMQQLGALPPDQRRVVARDFRELRDLPPDQRSAAMSRLPLNDAQRGTLGNLIRVEPLLPPPEKQ